MTEAAEATETFSVSVTGSVLVTSAFFSLTALAGPLTMTLAIAVTVGVIAWGWAGALGLPTPRGTVGVLLLGGMTILLSVGLPTGTTHLNWLPGALAVSIMTAFLHQLLRRDGRPRVAESVSAVLLALALFTCAAFLIPLARTDPGAMLVLAAMTAASVSAMVGVATRRLAHAFRPWIVPIALAAGGIAGGLVGLGSASSWTSFALVGVACAAVSHAVRLIFSVLPTMVHARPRVVVALSSVLVTGIIPYVVALVFLPSALPV
ncbi:MAG: hypothetical protein WA962_04975 [Ornithinimicrobium sp.]